MYTLVVKRGKSRDTGFDYTFKDFKTFYTVADQVTYPLKGRYKIKVDTENVKEINEFIKNEAQYSTLDTYLYVPEATAEYITQFNTKVNIMQSQRMIDVFMEMVSERNMLFEKGAVYALYNSIPHNTEDMEAALNLIMEAANGQIISERLLSKYFVLNNTVYPKSVLTAFIYMDRYRWSKLNKSVEQLGKEIVLGSMVKNIKSILKEKYEYFSTGVASPYIKSLNTANVLLLYRVLVTERHGLNDISILLGLYERGLSTHDLLHDEES